MKRSSLVLFAGVVAMAVVALHVNPAFAQKSGGASSYVSPLLPAGVEIGGKPSAPVMLTQGKHYDRYMNIPPRAPDYREYYGFGLPAYPPYGGADDLKSYFPYGGKYPSYGDSIYKYKACPPWATYPYEC